MFNFKGRVCVVTGASSGLGAHYAEVFAREGCNMAICARRTDLLEEVAEKCRSYGVECIVQACDVTKLSDVQAFVKAVYDKYGKCDILINNAGAGICGPFVDMPDEVIQKTIDLNLVALMRVTREFGREMIKAGYGRIINIGSTLAMNGMLPSEVAVCDYAASKGGVANFTRAIGSEWAQTGVTVNCVCPGWFESGANPPEAMEAMAPMINSRTPRGNRGEHHEMDSSLLYLAAEESTYVIGDVIHVDGGWFAV